MVDNVFQLPTIGRIVHFDSPDKGQRGYSADPVPAIITAVREDGSVDLTIFRNMMEPLPLANVQFSTNPTAGMRWFWPPRA